MRQTANLAASTQSMSSRIDAPANGRRSEPVFRPDIEGLRGIAVIFVLGYHAGFPGFSGGYVGVDVFFVLSGYLITSLLLNEIEGSGRMDLVRFYARRARRLFPALALVILVTIGASFIIFSPIEQRLISMTAVATNLYVSNLYFAVKAMDYHAPNAQLNPLLHTWSLGIEEQFYLVWPLLLFIVLRSKYRASQMPNSRRRVIVVMILVAVASLALSFVVTKFRPPWAFYSLPTRAWEFAMGALAIFIAGNNRTVYVRVAGWIGLALLLVSVVMFSKATPFPGIAALVPVGGTAALLWSGSRGSRIGVSKFLSWSGLQKLGRISYSWYLWHWPVIILVGAVTYNLTVKGRVACLLFSLVPALFSFLFVENPIRRRRVFRWSPGYSLAAGLALCLFCVVIAFAWRRVATHAATKPQQLRLMNAQTDWPVIYDNHCVSPPYGRGLISCSFNADRSSATMVLFGDSHAAQWFPVFNAISQKEGWELVTLIKSACPVADVEFFYPTMRRPYTECTQWRAQALQKIKEIRPNLIVLGSADVYVHSNEPLIPASAWQSGLRRTLETLADFNAQIVYVRDSPTPGFDVPICLVEPCGAAGGRLAARASRSDRKLSMIIYSSWSRTQQQDSRM